MRFRAQSMHVLGDHYRVIGDHYRVISDYNRNLHLLSIYLLHEVIFLGLYVVAMLENIVTILGE